MNARKVASIASIVLGVLFIAAAVFTALMVRSELDEQNIVTPADACLADRQVLGPFTAYCQAEVSTSTHPQKLPPSSRPPGAQPLNRLRLKPDDIR